MSVTPPVGLPEAAEAAAGPRTERAPLLWLALPWMAGLAAGRALSPAPATPLLALALAASGFSLWAAGRWPRAWAPALLLGLAAAGASRYVLAVGRVAAWDRWPTREARLTLRIDRVFPSAAPRQFSALAVVTATQPHLRSLLGQRIYCGLRLGRAAAPPRSAEIEALGLLSVVPRAPPAGTLDARLAGLGLNFRLSRGRLLRAGPPSLYAGALERLANKMTALLGAGFGRRPDLGAVYCAMMLGQKRDLSAGQRDLFLRSGTMHLFAINGLHIDVVALSVHAFLALLRCPAWGACGAILAVLWLDVSATGNSPSAMRAFAMVGSGEAAHTWHRPRSRLAALAAAALLALLLQPLDFFGASFQMSYGVVTVLLTFGLPLARHWQDETPRLRPRDRIRPLVRPRLWARARRWLLGALAVGAAAGLVSALTGIEFFGLFVPVGLAANLVVAPLAMLVIVAGVASLGLGLAGGIGASRFFNGAAGLLLRIITALLGVGARLPGAAFPAHYRYDWIGPAALAALVGLCLAGCAGGWNRKRGGFWPPVALVALAVAGGARFESSPPVRTAAHDPRTPALHPAAAPYAISMKSAYELAMERLAKSDPAARPKLNAEQKARLAEVDQVYKGKLAEREIFLKQQLDQAYAAQNADEVGKINRQIASEKSRLEEEREAEKDKIRQGLAK